MTQITSGQQTFSGIGTQGRVSHGRLRTARMPKPKEVHEAEPVQQVSAVEPAVENSVIQPARPACSVNSAVSIVVSPSLNAQTVKTTIVREAEAYQKPEETAVEVAVEIKHNSCLNKEEYWLEEIGSFKAFEQSAPVAVSPGASDSSSPDAVLDTMHCEPPAPVPVPDAVLSQAPAPDAISNVVSDCGQDDTAILNVVSQAGVLPIDACSQSGTPTLESPVVALDSTRWEEVDEIMVDQTCSISDTIIEETEELLKGLAAELPVCQGPDQAFAREALLSRLNEIGRQYSGLEIADRFDFELEERGDNRLGQLLVELGMITPELLEQSLHLSNDLSISLGRALIMSGWITGKQLQWAIQVQALLKDGLITRASASQVADLMTCSGMTVQRALNCAGYPDALRSFENRATRIGDLVIQAGLVSDAEFNLALSKAQSLGLPVGRFLLVSGLIPEPLLETVVNAQRFVREGKISRDDAITAISAAAERQKRTCGVSTQSIYSQVPLKTMRLGELLTVAGIVTDVHIDHAVEFGLRCNVPIGQVLVDLEIVTERTLETALTLQGLVARDSLEPIEAAYALIDVHHHGMSLSQALKRNRAMSGERRNLSFEQFLASLELISVSQIEEAIETARRSPTFVSKALVFSGALADETVQVALMCHFYVRESMLTAEEALLLFNICHRTGLPVEDGMTELGLTVRAAASTAA